MTCLVCFEEFLMIITKLILIKENEQLKGHYGNQELPAD